MRAWIDVAILAKPKNLDGRLVVRGTAGFPFLLEEGDEVVIVTDGFHIFRGVSMAKKFGLEPTHLHSKSYIPQLPLNFVRELAAVMKMFVLGK